MLQLWPEVPKKRVVEGTPRQALLRKQRDQKEEESDTHDGPREQTTLQQLQWMDQLGHWIHSTSGLRHWQV